MPTPPKPFTVLKAEGKSHRTKKELKAREQGEKALSSGKTLKERQEVKNNPIAHKEFKRVNSNLKAISKNDSVYENVINRYCLIMAECQDFETKREEIYALIQELKSTYDIVTKNLDEKEKSKMLIDFSREMAKLSTSLINFDRQIQTKRKMLLDIEKENVMTIAAALRSIPKTEPETTAKDKLLKALNGN